MTTEASPSIEDAIKATPAAKHWEKIGIKNHHGICLPLSALHSENSCGIGEFLDLLPLIDWCAEVGMDVLQLLPLNDSGLDASPYNGVSAFALHPIYLSLGALPDVNKSDFFTGRLTQLKMHNSSQRVAYRHVRELKESFLKNYFHLNGKAIQSTDDYRQFVSMHQEWLEPYALFHSIKETHKWKPWQHWPLELQDPTPDLVSKLRQEYDKRVQFHTFIQYLCFAQMEGVKKYATARGVLIKGDIPILISPDSADVWWNRSLFNLNLSVGVPPDMFNASGQNWGFPHYNWQTQESSDYHWWRTRLQVAEQFYHLFRLDHVVGFYRVWAYPKGASASEGRFYPDDVKDWISHGDRLLRMMLDTTPMLPIGEDLGTVPDEVRQHLKMLGIPGTKVLRWERDWQGDGHYLPFSKYPALSMTTLSTHDLYTVKGWWEEKSGDAKAFCQFKGWTYEPTLSKERYREILHDAHHTGSLFHVNLFQEYLAAIPGLSWRNPEDDRINFPGQVNSRNWTYRFRPSLEQMVLHPALKDLVQDLLK